MKNKTLYTFIITFLFITMLVLNITGAINISYWLVFSPLYAPPLILIAWILISFCIGSAYVFFKRKK